MKVSMVSCRRTHSQQVSLGIGASIGLLFLLLKYEQTIKVFQTYENIILFTTNKKERKIKRDLEVRKMIAEIKNSKFSVMKKIFSEKQAKKGKNIKVGEKGISLEDKSGRLKKSK